MRIRKDAASHSSHNQLYHNQQHDDSTLHDHSGGSHHYQRGGDRRKWLYGTVSAVRRVQYRFYVIILIITTGLALFLFSKKSWAFDSFLPTASSQQAYHTDLPEKHLGAVLFLAPARFAGSMWGIDRFCMLLRAVRSVDQHLNSNSNIPNNYPIYILIAQDYDDYKTQQFNLLQHDTKQEGPYSQADRELIRRWAPNSTIEFVDIDMYDGPEALEPNTTVQQIFDWRAGKDGGIKGRNLGYASMCRLWSGRLQQMTFLDDFEFYLRMDDDSLLTEDLPWDPFVAMKSRNLTYAYKRAAKDTWGINELWDITRPHLDFERNPIFVDWKEEEEEEKENGRFVYTGKQPYNNFHVARISFWRSAEWLRLWDLYNQNHLFYKYRVGDANVHAMATMMMEENAVEQWEGLPYVHNSNDYGPSWGTKAWVEECQHAYKEFLNQ